jgi:hypothetical protein
VSHLESKVLVERFKEQRMLKASSDNLPSHQLRVMRQMPQLLPGMVLGTDTMAAISMAAITDIAAIEIVMINLWGRRSFYEVQLYEVQFCIAASGGDSNRLCCNDECTTSFRL